MEWDLIEIKDKFGLPYSIIMEYHYELGFSNALYEDDLIAKYELNELHEPSTDNDIAWKTYEQQKSEWIDEMKTHLISRCEAHFNKR